MNFIGGMRLGFSFILLHLDVQLFQHHLLKKTTLPLNYLGILVRAQLTVNVRICFWALNSSPSICRSVLMLLPQCLDYRSFVVSFVWVLYILFQDSFGCLVPLHFHVNFRHILSSASKGSWNYERYDIESVDQFKECCHLNNIKPHHEHRESIYLFRFSFIFQQCFICLEVLHFC